MDGMPDHDQIMKGVHGLLGEHLSDHSGAMMDSINQLPLPPDEKVLLQAIENMQEAALSQTLEEIEKIKNRMPDHEALVKGVHGLLSDHLGDHSAKIAAAVDGLPLPPDEKIMLQSMEEMQQSCLQKTLEEINKLRSDVEGHTRGLHGKFEDHGKTVGNLMSMLDGLPDHDAIMTGVHGLLGDHIGDHAGKVMGQIDKLPLPPDEKIMLQAIENMEESVMSSVLEAVEVVRTDVAGYAESVTKLHNKVATAFIQDSAATPAPATTKLSYTPTRLRSDSPAPKARSAGLSTSGVSAEAPKSTQVRSSSLGALTSRSAQPTSPPAPRSYTPVKFTSALSGSAPTLSSDSKTKKFEFSAKSRDVTVVTERTVGAERARLPYSDTSQEVQAAATKKTEKSTGKLRWNPTEGRLVPS